MYLKTLTISTLIIALIVWLSVFFSWINKYGFNTSIYHNIFLVVVGIINIMTLFLIYGCWFDE